MSKQKKHRQPSSLIQRLRFAEDEKKYVLEVQLLGASEHYSSMARFHTTESYAAIMGLETLG